VKGCLDVLQLSAILNSVSIPFKTLIIRFSSIGDVVLSTPLVRILRAKFPDGQIDYLTKKQYSELVRSNQNLNVTHEYDPATGYEGLKALREKLRAERYTHVIDIHNSIRSRILRGRLGAEAVYAIDKAVVERTMLVKLKKNMYKGLVSVVDRYIKTAEPLGVTNDGRGLELHIPDETLFGVSAKIARFRLNRFEKVLGICPGAKHATKRWPAERFADLGSRFCREHDGCVLIFGGSEDRELCQRIGETIGRDKAFDLSGELSLLETGSAMQSCDVIVTNDTGLMHIAVAMNRKIVAIFGSTVKEFGFFPLAKDSIVLERKGLACRPCSHIGRSECPEKHFRCMNEISPDDVVQSVSSFIA
jgi:lipopolysaccharide heptosyltransferase II